MIKEAYCSFEVAKLLKGKGFDEPCLQMWECGPDKKYLFRLQSSCYQNITEEDSCLAPTHQMAMAWLREKYYIHIDIVIEGNGSCIEYVYAIRDFSIIFPTRNSDSIDVNYKGRAASYEEAIEAGLKYCLENLI